MSIVSNNQKTDHSDEVVHKRNPNIFMASFLYIDNN